MPSVCLVRLHAYGTNPMQTNHSLHATHHDMPMSAYAMALQKLHCMVSSWYVWLEGHTPQHEGQEQYTGSLILRVALGCTHERLGSTKLAGACQDGMHYKLINALANNVGMQLEAGRLMKCKAEPYYQAQICVPQV